LRDNFIRQQRANLFFDSVKALANLFVAFLDYASNHEIAFGCLSKLPSAQNPYNAVDWPRSELRRLSRVVRISLS
jgi:hypothetical protein